MTQIEKLLAAVEKAEVKVANAKAQLVDALVNAGEWHCLSPNITSVRRLIKDAGVDDTQE